MTYKDIGQFIVKIVGFIAMNIAIYHYAGAYGLLLLNGVIWWLPNFWFGIK